MTTEVTDNIYAVLRAIMNANPEAEPGTIKRLYVDAIVNAPDLKHGFVEEFYSNIGKLVAKEQEPKRKRKTQAEKQESVRKYIETILGLRK